MPIVPAKRARGGTYSVQGSNLSKSPFDPSLKCSLARGLLARLGQPDSLKPLLCSIFAARIAGKWPRLGMTPPAGRYSAMEQAQTRWLDSTDLCRECIPAT